MGILYATQNVFQDVSFKQVMYDVPIQDHWRAERLATNNKHILEVHTFSFILRGE